MFFHFATCVASARKSVANGMFGEGLGDSDRVLIIAVRVALV